MRRADLVLWMLVHPWSTVSAGILAGLASYALSRPRGLRAHAHRGDLAVEAWRLVAIISGLPAFFLGAELMLWGRDLAFRAPLAFTGLAWAAGLWLLSLAPIPLLAAWTRFRPLTGAPSRRAAILAGLGIAGILLGPWAGRRAWTDLVARAAEQPEALEQLIQLKAHRYVSAERAEAALDALVAEPDAVLDLYEAQGPRFDPDLRVWLVDRLETALVDDRPVDIDRALPAIWAASGDPERSLRAYALSQPELRQSARAAADLEGTETSSGDPGQPVAGPTIDRAELDPGVVGLHGLRAAERGAAGAELRATLLSLLVPLLNGRSLEPALVDALVGAVDAPAPAGPTALSILLRDGSQAALRPILPRFVDARGERSGFEGPSWEVLRRDCMSRTSSLRALREDEDPRVAAGAREVLLYVRQYCRRAAPPN